MKKVDINGASFTIRNAARLEEVEAVQRLDTQTWPEGYKHYRQLYTLDSSSIIIAVDERSGEVGSYVGAERIHSFALGQGMPAWDHTPNGWHKPSGSCLYITGHVVREEFRRSNLSHEVISYLKGTAAGRLDIDLIAVILRLNHPTLGKASKFWEHHGFSRLEHTLDPEWKASPEAEDSGGVIYTIETPLPIQAF